MTRIFGATTSFFREAKILAFLPQNNEDSVLRLVVYIDFEIVRGLVVTR